MRRRTYWLVAAVLLFVAGAWLMSRSDETPARPPARAEVEFPRHMQHRDLARMERRQHPALPPAPAPDQNAPPQLVTRDPVLRAMTGIGSKRAMVIEANAIRHSPVGELLLDCVRNGSNNSLEWMKRELGFDPTEQIDRVALGDDTLLMSGDFKGVKWDELLNTFEASSHGEHGRIFRGELKDPNGNPRSEFIAVWNDQMVVRGDTEEQVRSALDRIEGRAPLGEPLLTDASTYGEMYGVFAAADFARLFEEVQPELAARLMEVAQSVELHADTSSDVGMVADVKGSDPAAIGDLAKSLGAALSLARLKAQTDGAAGADTAELLELARVRPGGNSLSMELALPMAFLEKHLAFCREPRVPDATPAPADPLPGVETGNVPAVEFLNGIEEEP